MMMKKAVLLFVMIATFSTAGFSQRFAYVDTEYILENIPAFAKAQEELDQVSAQWQSEIERRLKEIDDMYKAFQAEQVLLNNDMKQKRIAEIEKKERAVKEYQKEKFGPNGELFKKRQELVKPIQDDIYNEVQKLANTKGYDFIFDKSSGVSMLFANERYDKSDDILKELGYK